MDWSTPAGMTVARDMALAALSACAAAWSAPGGCSRMTWRARRTPACCRSAGLEGTPSRVCTSSLDIGQNGRLFSQRHKEADGEMVLHRVQTHTYCDCFHCAQANKSSPAHCTSTHVKPLDSSSSCTRLSILALGRSASTATLRTRGAPAAASPGRRETWRSVGMAWEWGGNGRAPCDEGGPAEAGFAGVASGFGPQKTAAHANLQELDAQQHAIA